MAEKQIITHFNDKQQFFELQQYNPGIIIIKLGAKWCKPCKTIAPIVDAFFATSPAQVICCNIDIDESFELYSHFNKNRIINGVPALLCYKKGNTSIYPDDSVIGASPVQLNNFFKRCGKLYHS